MTLSTRSFLVDFLVLMISQEVSSSEPYIDQFKRFSLKVRACDCLLMCVEQFIVSAQESFSTLHLLIREILKQNQRFAQLRSCQGMQKHAFSQIYAGWKPQLRIDSLHTIFDEFSSRLFDLLLAVSVHAAQHQKKFKSSNFEQELLEDIEILLEHMSSPYFFVRERWQSASNVLENLFNMLLKSAQFKPTILPGLLKNSMPILVRDPNLLRLILSALAEYGTQSFHFVSELFFVPGTDDRNTSLSKDLLEIYKFQISRNAEAIGTHLCCVVWSLLIPCPDV